MMKGVNIKIMLGANKEAKQAFIGMFLNVFFAVHHSKGTRHVKFVRQETWGYLFLHATFLTLSIVVMDSPAGSGISNETMTLLGNDTSDPRSETLGFLHLIGNSTSWLTAESPLILTLKLYDRVFF